MAQQERLPDSLGYDCKQRRGGKKEAERVWGSSALSSPSCSFDAVVLVFKGVSLLFLQRQFNMTHIQKAYTVQPLHILYI